MNSKHLILSISLLSATLTHSVEPKANPANPAKPGAADPPNSEYMGMKLAPDWIPKRESNALELAKSLSFFCTAAVQGREKGNDLMPKTIFANLTWLMPMEDAEKSLKGMIPQMGAAIVIKSNGFPQRSLFVRTYSGSFADPHLGGTFKELRLVADVNRHLVAVEILHNHPPAIAVTWPSVEAEWWTSDPWVFTGKNVKLREATAKVGNLPGATGKREPYYEFLTPKDNAASDHYVKYAIYRKGKVTPSVPEGVTCVQTALTDPPGGRRVLGAKAPEVENVRWYLPAPLARKILEIANGYMPGGEAPQ